MLRALLASRPAREIGTAPLVGSAAAHAAVIVAVLMTARGASPNSHGLNQLAREATPVVHLQYLKLIPMDPAASGKAPDASENHETTPRGKPSASSNDDGLHRLPAAQNTQP